MGSEIHFAHLAKLLFVIPLLLLSVFILAFPNLALPHMVAGAVNFQSPAPLEINMGTDRLPSSIHLANGQLWLAWEVISLSGQTSILYITYNGIWSNPQTFASGPGSVSNISPSLAQLQNGTIILAWSTNQTGHYNLYYKLNNNGAWSGTTRLTSTSSDDYLPKLVVATDSTLWVFWERDSNSASCISGLCRQIFYKTLKANQWSSDVSFTTNSFWSSMPGPTATSDGRVWLSWSSSNSASTGFNIMYTVYNGQWSNSLALTSTTTSDTHPDLVADRNGTLWLFFARDIVLSSGTNGVSENDLYYSYSYNTGSSWTSPVQLTAGGTASNPVDSMDPSAVQGSDKMLWLFYSTDVTGGGSSFDLYYIRSYPISTHDVTISNAQYPPFQYPGGLASFGESPIMKINLTITNIGDFTDSISLTATISNITSYNLGTISRSITAGQSLTLTFNWNTTGVKPARYTLLATVTDTAEPVLNTYNNGISARDIVRVIPLGDVDQNGTVTIGDVSVFFYDFGFGPRGNPCPPGHCVYYPFEDINNNGLVDIIDVGIAAFNFGTAI